MADNPGNVQNSSVSETTSQTNPLPSELLDSKVDTNKLLTILIQNRKMVKFMSALIQTLSITKLSRVWSPWEI